MITYDARLHQHLARPGELLVSYNVNSLDPADNRTDASLYRPRFVEVALPPALRAGASPQAFVPRAPLPVPH
ncbi:hypothetical protein ABT160_32630 [Streptomyces sp. NPDC001941]|uniref:hypothetical protein n=1 Tax=Streptomyces sp. NPDC001941 TaxID=3154659 RepID=UPI00332A73B6